MAHPADRYKKPHPADKYKEAQSRSIGERVTGAAEAAAAMGSAALTEVPAGLAGLANYVANVMRPDAAEIAGNEVNRIRGTAFKPTTEAGQEYLQNIGETVGPFADAIFGKPGRWLGEKAMDFTGNPAIAAWAETAPTAVATLIGAPKAGGNTPGFLYKADGLPNKLPPRPRIDPRVSGSADDLANTSDDAVRADMTAAQRQAEYEGLAKSIDRQRAGVVAEEINPDPAIVEAARRQGITLNPSAVSQNTTYIELEQALKSRPNSGISAREAAGIRQIGEKADDLIDSLGGSTDKGVFDLKLRSEIDQNIAFLRDASERIRTNRVNARIPARGVVNPKNAKSYITSRLDDLGGDRSLLNPEEKELLRLVDENNTLTYAGLDKLRRDVGRGFEGQGPYADSDSFILKKVYGALSDDQLAAADGFGYGDSLRLANRVDQSRFGLQEAAQALYGKNLDKSVLPKVRAVAGDLVKGNTVSLTEMLNTVPSPLRRQTSVAVLNEIFTYGSRAGDKVGPGFATAYRALVRNKTAYEALMKELPKSSRQTFDDLGRIADGLYRAKALENTSKTARDVIAALDNPRSLDKIYRGAAEIGALEGAATAAGIPPGIGATVGLAHRLIKARTPASVAADDFIGSPALRNAIDLAAQGKLPQANQVISRSDQFKKWVVTLPESDQQAITRIGVIGWLTSQDDE